MMSGLHMRTLRERDYMRSISLVVGIDAICQSQTRVAITRKSRLQQIHMHEKVWITCKQRHRIHLSGLYRRSLARIECCAAMQHSLPDQSPPDHDSKLTMAHIEELPAMPIRKPSCMEVEFHRLINHVHQMMFVSGETADVTPETTSMIESIVQQQVMEMVCLSKSLFIFTPY